MNNEQKKLRKRVIFSFILCLCIALVCFGIFGYLAVTYRGTEMADENLVTISKIFVLAGIFFLVIAFGYALPNLISQNKRKNGIIEADTGDTFNEATMRQALDKYIPVGETMLAGIHAIAKESSVTCVFGECSLTEDKLVVNKSGSALVISKKKYSTYDIYIGITQHSLVVADCQAYRYLYEFNKEPIKSETDIQMVTEDILLKDIGKCFPLADVQSCKVKNGFAGAVNCLITMKNGSYFKLIFPKYGGLGGGMPHHGEYRDAIIACLDKMHDSY